MNSHDDQTTGDEAPRVLAFDLRDLAEYDPSLLAEALSDLDTQRITEGGVRDEPAFSRLERFTVEVETLMDCLMPIWSAEFPIVQVSRQQPANERSAGDPFTYCNPAGAVFLVHAGIKSLKRLTLHYPRADGTQFSVELDDGHQVHVLRAELPSDARRAELVHRYDDTHLGANDTPLVTALNERPDKDIALLHALRDSTALVAAAGIHGAWIPAHSAELWEIDDTIRHSGLYTAAPPTRNVAERLAPSWRLSLTDLRQTAKMVTSAVEGPP
jgi:hypothetical protein